MLGFTAKSGFIFGDAGPFFTELYSMGGVQFGIPLRGYDEFAITPDGFDPTRRAANAASPDAFGKSFAAFTVEFGRADQPVALRQHLLRRRQRLSRRAAVRSHAGSSGAPAFGAAVISPLGPIGVDLGYGFDRVDMHWAAPIPGGSCTSGWAISSEPRMESGHEEILV